MVRLRSKVIALVVALILSQVTVNNGYSSFVLSDGITYFPDEAWIATDPEEQNMSNYTLTQMMQFIEDSGSNVRGLVITRNGYIVKEAYWNYNTENTTRHIFSCTKSFTGALIGIAIKEGFIDNVSQRMIDFFPNRTIDNMDARKEAITLEHLLTMTHGLDWNEWNNSYSDPENMYNRMFLQSGDPVQFFLDLPTAYDPGTHWVYTTGASHMLSAIIQEATGMTTRAFAQDYLFDPLNMTIGGWATDNQGINNGGTLLYVTPRAMTKLGLLYLNNGTWNGREIMTEEYVTQSSTPYVNADLLAPEYGYQWWVDSEQGVFSAMGSEGQYIHVVPDYSIVMSMTASFDNMEEDINEEILEYVLNSIFEGPEPNDEPFIPIISIAVVVLVAAIGFLYRQRMLSKRA
ncbi:MAG: serine hydrolase domain-containing protein [Candidatus Thorarchaeota archaeon]